MKKKIAVIGGAGFIGSNIVDALISSGEDVVVIDDFSTGKLENVNLLASVHSIDISKITPASLSRIINDCDSIYYLAALARVQLSFDDVLRYNEVNIVGLLITLEAMLICNIKKIVFSSSSSIYGNAELIPTPEECEAKPMSPYATQKIAAENYLLSYTLKHDIFAVCLRYFNVYGERMQTEGAYSTVIGRFLNKLQSPGDRDLEITNDGDQRRDFTYVGDVVQANLKAMEHLKKSIHNTTVSNIKKSKKYFIFNVGTGENYSVLDIADLFPLKRKFVGEVIEPFETCANNSKIRYELGWSSTTNVLDWVREKIEKIKG